MHAEKGQISLSSKVVSGEADLQRTWIQPRVMDFQQHGGLTLPNTGPCTSWVLITEKIYDKLMFINLMMVNIYLIPNFRDYFKSICPFRCVDWTMSRDLCFPKTSRLRRNQAVIIDNDKVNGHFRNRERLEVPTIYKAYVRKYPHKIWPYMVLTYLHFRILEISHW